MKTTCPECERLNAVTLKSIVECYGFEYSCTCGYYLYVSDWSESDAFKSFNEKIIEDRQKKLMPKCNGCGD